MIYGCDEAGKGPVLGSMFVACVSGDKCDIPHNVRDSKSISTTQKIHRLSNTIQDQMDVYVAEATPKEIDARSLTDVSVDKFSEAILGTQYELCDTGYIDSFINNRDTVRDRISSQISPPKSQQLCVEFGADEIYPIVSAASIVAKSKRERHIDRLSEEYGDIGSGYPSDPNTRQFLREYIDQNGDVPPITRRSWSTVEDMLE